MSAQDAHYMARAIRLAERGLYTTKPNPRVGCVLVRDQQIIAEAWHQQAGQAHAEALALAAAGDAARGATAYVSLEPCNHQGRTPPCSQALIKAGVSRVVYAAADVGHGAGGAQALREAGIEVRGGLLEAEAQALNPGFHRRCAGGLPWLRLKLAMSLDGRAALPDGQSQWITAQAARRDGHRWRARSDAIITGIGTVLADNPRMTARLEVPLAQPLRVVLDSALRTPADAALRADEHYLIAHAEGAGEMPRGLALPRAAGGELDLVALLEALAARGCNELLLEAGPKLSAAFIRAQLVDELIVYQAASLLGEGLPTVDLGRLQQLSERIDWQIREIRRFGADLRIIAHPLNSA